MFQYHSRTQGRSVSTTGKGTRIPSMPSKNQINCGLQVNTEMTHRGTRNFGINPINILQFALLSLMRMRCSDVAVIDCVSTVRCPSINTVGWDTVFKMLIGNLWTSYYLLNRQLNPIKLFPEYELIGGNLCNFPQHIVLFVSFYLTPVVNLMRTYVRYSMGFPYFCSITKSCTSKEGFSQA